MKKVCTPAAVAAAFFACAPAASAAAPPDERAAAALAARMDVGTSSTGRRGHAGKRRAVRANVALARKIARLEDDKLTRSERARVRSRPLGVLITRTPRLRDRLERLERRERRRERRLAERQAAVAAPAAAASTASPALEAIAACESGGDPAAIGGGGLYRGKYQFDQQTWESVGGVGDPAAASEAEQDARAAALYAQQGSSPWPSCGG